MHFRPFLPAKSVLWQLRKNDLIRGTVGGEVVAEANLRRSTGLAGGKNGSTQSWMNSGGIVIARKEIRETLMKLFEAETGEPLDSLTDDQNLAEHLGLDSVDMVSLIMQLERHFKIRLSHEELAQAAQVGQLLDIVEQKVNAPAEANPATGGDASKIAA